MSNSVALDSECFLEDEMNLPRVGINLSEVVKRVAVTLFRELDTLSRRVLTYVSKPEDELRDPELYAQSHGISFVDNVMVTAYFNIPGTHFAGDPVYDRAHSRGYVPLVLDRGQQECLWFVPEQHKEAA
jgi:hypothetical protein|tara:strand:- start:446 stop:832 length:387 start_codon:yes stop_codon:yes gene_type:complete